MGKNIRTSKSLAHQGQKEQRNDINLSHENNPARSPVKESDYFTMYVQILTGFHHTYVNRVIMITM